MTSRRDNEIQIRWDDDGTESPNTWMNDAIKVTDLDEPLEISEEAWKALCAKYGAAAAQGLDLAAFAKLLGGWSGGAETVAKLQATAKRVAERAAAIAALPSTA